MVVVTIISLRPRASPFKSNDRVLIVTAHPDDECMFFGPTLCHLADRNIQAKVLCLSKGNFYGKGDQRTKELEAACKTYSAENECLNNFKDGPFMWPASKIQETVRSHVSKFRATCIVTFDQEGVSGHRNHISCSAIQPISNIRVLHLESVSILRKFTATIDLGVTFFAKKPYVVAGSLRSVKAMFCHRSQLEWFRFLYICFSRYMTINSYHPISSNK